MQKVTISPVLNGFLVTVGCSEVVFNSIEHLCVELRRYQENPAAVEKEYLTKAINRSKSTVLASPGVGVRPMIEVGGATRTASEFQRGIR